MKRIKKRVSDATWKQLFAEKEAGVTTSALSKKYGIEVGTINSKQWRMRKAGNLDVGRVKQGQMKQEQKTSLLKVGDKAVVVDGALPKQNGMIITVTRFGPKFVEGIAPDGSPVAAYKVRKAQPPYEIKPEPQATVLEQQAMETTPTPVLEDEEIIWERKLIYDVQTANHLYKVRVESKEIQILDGDDNTITIARSRLNDISLILKKLPEITGEA